MEIFHKEAKTGPKDFFLYVAMMAALYLSAGSLIKLLFDIINALYPDQLTGLHYDLYSASLRLAIASLIIIFPIYLLVTRYLAQDLINHPEKKNLGIRRWLVYLTLFLTGVIIVGDLVAIINIFLNGELTARFILKALAVLTVAGGIFSGYGYVIKTTEPKKKIINTFILISTAVVLAAIIGGFVIAGSPVKARKIRFDSQRITDLQNIQWQVVNFWQNKRELPRNLAALTDSISGFQAPIDPVTGEAYGYTVLGPFVFELCADFALPSTDVVGRLNVLPQPVFEKSNPFGAESDNWSHESGRVCFERIIDPDFYVLKN